MTELDVSVVEQQARQAAAELLEAAKLHPGDIFVVGCSSSEILGGRIGHASSLEAAQAAFRGSILCCRRRGSTWQPSAAST